MIYSETGGYQGIGFAIPSNLARQIMDELKDNGHGAVGIDRRDPVDQRRSSHGQTERVRRRDGRVRPEHRARAPRPHRAGLQPGDIIVSVNGKAVDRPEQLERT